MRAALLLALGLTGCAVEPDAAPDPIAPGRFAARRLTRAELGRTLRDLLGQELPVTGDLPPDDSAHGLDVVASALATSPLHVEIYEQVATAAAAVILYRPLDAPVRDTVQAETPIETDGNPWNAPNGEHFVFGSGGTAWWAYDVPQEGSYDVTVRAAPQHAGDDGVRMGVWLDEVHIAAFELPQGDPEGFREVTVRVDLPRRPIRLGLSFDNDFYDPEVGADRNVVIDLLRVEGPVDFEPEQNPAFDALVGCDPTALDCARPALARMLPRLWRRPVDDAEIDALLSLRDAVVAGGGAPKDGLSVAVRAALMSPRFLFHIEPVAVTAGPIDPYSLASRLSYFVWSSAPDDELYALAADGSLSEPSVLRAQARRLLRDPRARALTDELAEQWLGIRLVRAASPDVWTFPEFDGLLQESMAGEMVTFFNTFVGTDRPLTELLTSEWVYVDNRLAAFYGLPMPNQQGFFPAGALSEHRGGWLRQGGLLMALSYPTRTSPVRRGVWVLSELLCEEPDPPPPSVPGFPEPTEAATTVRERLEQHRKIVVCASCHDEIDPIGLAFEHYDGIGRWRDSEDGLPIDATGALLDGTTFDGADELQRLLSKDPRVYGCMAEKLFVWSHHRAPSGDDARALEGVMEVFHAGGFTLDALVEGLVTSPTFTHTQPPEGE